MGKILLMFPSITVCLLLTVLTQTGSCHTREGATNKEPAQIHDKLATGAWGGQDIRAQVKDDGADIEFGCASATIDEPIILNSAGGFDVKGKFAARRPGPTRAGENNSVAARFVGHLRDQELTLTISNLESKESIGTFTLTHGGAARVKRCH
jgi:hypothetical protein